VYVGVGEALGLDLHLVDLPDHMFVRWQLNDGSHLNWDTNSAQTIPDKEYASDYSLNKRIRKERIYLATMTRREEEGFAYFLRATRFEESEENKRAIADLIKARELYPQSTQAASELAWLYATTDGIDLRHRIEAIDLAQGALDYEPRCGEFWDALAASHAGVGEFKLAAKEAQRAEFLAESPEERAEFKRHRKAFEKEKRVNGARVAH
jgi:tetratricopeptide (TPR) repeat protein